MKPQRTSSESPEQTVASRYSRVAEYRKILYSFAREHAIVGVRAPQVVDPIQWIASAFQRIGQAGKLGVLADALEHKNPGTRFGADVRGLIPYLEGPLRIWHLSDLHFGRKHKLLPSPAAEGPGYPLSASILRLLDRRSSINRPDVIVISGDLSWQADVWQNFLQAHGLPDNDWPPELPAAASFLRELSSRLRPVHAIPANRRILVVPGNHDVAWIGDARPLDSFRGAISEKTFVTPYSRTRRRAGTPSGITVRSKAPQDDAPVSVAECSIRGIQLIMVLLVSHYWEGRPFEPELQIDRDAQREIERVRALACGGRWAALQRQELERALEFVHRFAIHHPRVTSQYIDESLALLRQVVGDDTAPNNQLRLCVSHAPLVEVGGGRGEVAEGGESLWFAWDSAFNSDRQSAFHAVLSGHLHAMRMKYSPRLKGWSFSAGTAGAEIDPNAVPAQRGNNFAELTVEFTGERLTGTYVPQEWNGETWLPDQKSRQPIRGA